MLGSWIGPIVWTLVIRQVQGSLYLESYLRRRILKFLIVMDRIKTFIHIYSKVYGQYYYHSYDTLVAGLSLQSTHVDWVVLSQDSQWRRS